MFARFWGPDVSVTDTPKKVRFASSLVLLLALPAWAEAVSLDYQRPDGEGCPDEVALRKLVAARLGVDPFVTDAASKVTVKISAGKPLRAEVSLESAGATRKKALTGADCVELAQSAAVTVALVVDPLVVRAPEPAPAPEPVAAPPAPATAPPPAAPAPDPAPPEPRETLPLRWGAGLGISVNGGLSLGVQPVLRAEGRAYAGRWSLGLEGRFAIPVTGGLQSGALTTSALLAAVVPCLHVWWFAGCADVTLGGLRLEGSALAAAQAATVFHASAGLRAVFSVPVSERLFISALAEGQVPFTRTSAVVGDTKVWTVPPVGGGLGVNVSFVL